MTISRTVIAPNRQITRLIRRNCAVERESMRCHAFFYSLKSNHRDKIYKNRFFFHTILWGDEHMFFYFSSNKSSRVEWKRLGKKQTTNQPIKLVTSITFIWFIKILMLIPMLKFISFYFVEPEFFFTHIETSLMPLKMESENEEKKWMFGNWNWGTTNFWSLRNDATINILLMWIQTGREWESVSEWVSAVGINVRKTLWTVLLCIYAIEAP